MAEDGWSSSTDRLDYGGASGKSTRTTSSSLKSGVSSAGAGLMQYGKDQTDRASEISANIRPVSYKKGGRVKKTGLARLHKDEVVIPRNKVKRTQKAVREYAAKHKKRGKSRSSGR